MDIKKPLLVKVEAFIYAFVYSCVRSSATPSRQGNIYIQRKYIVHKEIYYSQRKYIYKEEIY